MRISWTMDDRHFALEIAPDEPLDVAKRELATTVRGAGFSLHLVGPCALKLEEKLPE